MFENNRSPQETLNGITQIQEKKVSRWTRVGLSLIILALRIQGKKSDNKSRGYWIWKTPCSQHILIDCMEKKKNSSQIDGKRLHDKQTPTQDQAGKKTHRNPTQCTKYQNTIRMNIIWLNTQGISGYDRGTLHPCQHQSRKEGSKNHLAWPNLNKNPYLSSECREW